MMTISQLDILHHTLGVNAQRREPWRNHYVASAGHHAQHDIAALVAAGMMAEGHRPAFLAQGDLVYFVTDAGREAAIDQLPLPPKRSRYDEFLDADYGHSFAEWLGIELPELEHAGWHARGPKDHYRYTRPEFTRGDRWSPLITGEWKPTMKEAKSSYKLALAQTRARLSGEVYA